MSENLNWKPGKALDPFAGKRGASTDGRLRNKATADDFPSDFAKLKLSVIRPAFESIGNRMKERGHQFNISEDPGGKISIHIVPPGANQSIHPYDWFPTFSLYGAPFTRKIGVHGRNMRPNSAGSTGERGDYPLAQVSKEIVEKELMTFIGEIANW
ncbi:MAG: hypothetical protein ACRET7_00275 [Burkholderiales bacterium]